MNYTHETVLTVDIPDLGPAAVSAGVNFLRVAWGTDTVEPVEVFGKRYRDEVTVQLDGTVEVNRWSSFTPAATRRIIERLNAWAPAWIASNTARELIAATVDYHNAIGERMIRDEIDRATNHLRELEMIADRYRSAESGEYVSRVTSRELRDR